ncbi:hypothetical protein EDC94DRAFT_25837, partial [Helicostylum pulchrum]
MCVCVCRLANTCIYNIKYMMASFRQATNQTLFTAESRFFVHRLLFTYFFFFFIPFFFLFHTVKLDRHYSMTDTSISQSIPNEPLFEETVNITERDITDGDGTPDTHHPCQDHHQRLHNPGDSESEEDLTEEHVDTNLLETQLHNLHLDPIPTLETQNPTTDSTTQQDCNAGTLQPIA